MRLSMTHAFPCSPDELWAIFDDPSFNVRMGERTGVARELLEQRSDAQGSYVRWRVISNKEIPAVMAKAIGADRISYEQESRRKAGTQTLEWTIIPMVLANKFTGSGTTTVRATPTGCERVIEGDLVVKVPIVGKQMETKLLESVQESYAQTAALALEIIEARRSAS